VQAGIRQHSRIERPRARRARQPIGVDVGRRTDDWERRHLVGRADRWGADPGTGSAVPRPVHLAPTGVSGHDEIIVRRASRDVVSRYHVERTNPVQPDPEYCRKDLRRRYTDAQSGERARAHADHETLDLRQPTIALLQALPHQWDELLDVGAGVGHRRGRQNLLT
jgi:hypothetical protein